ncbi:DUF721 domain-containing protein [Marinobacter sp. M3C]|jgi:hypothetical protein|uniref:DciA family protein n=1 Tax=Marinobacter sp. M3C TaxID=2917715 RepID=UPI00200D3922|nr:DciA family protein [Marinobacter sp. M3C]MCL1477019.1 DUF721 domain-containing protein [Marinobacter sp.]MCL1482871.1 DUF721 domain-containing protein [Marinobacter sp.]UQG61891.1 DUF721 domain-containing protein [Marinobacter sp. M3C]
MTPKNEQKMTFDPLSGPAGLRKLVARAEQHRLAEQALLAELPPSLQSGTRFVSCHEGELVLAADSGPKASQIRFRQHDIMAAARNLELFRFVWKLKVKVVPPRFQDKAMAKKLPLSKENAQLLKEEAGHTKDKALREILEKLASHVRD